MGLIDGLLGWNSRRSGAVEVGRGTVIAWRRLNRVSGNRLSIGEIRSFMPIYVLKQAAVKSGLEAAALSEEATSNAKWMMAGSRKPLISRRLQIIVPN